jgi:hypothetical protein
MFLRYRIAAWPAGGGMVVYVAEGAASARKVALTAFPSRPRAGPWRGTTGR